MKQGLTNLADLARDTQESLGGILAVMQPGELEELCCRRPCRNRLWQRGWRYPDVAQRFFKRRSRTRASAQIRPMPPNLDRSWAKFGLHWPTSDHTGPNWPTVGPAFFALLKFDQHPPWFAEIRQCRPNFVHSRPNIGPDRSMVVDVGLRLLGQSCSQIDHHRRRSGRHSVAGAPLINFGATSELAGFVGVA